MSEISGPDTSRIDERVRERLQQWSQKLLDLSKRNRALNFKPGRSSSLTIVDELPVQVWKRIVIQKNTMRFVASLPSVKGPSAENEEQSDGSDRFDDEADVFEAESNENLSPRHTDDRLQVNATPEGLSTTLRKLDADARANIEEQGVNVLFLGLGMLHYTEAPESKEKWRAPLVLVPVTLSRKSARNDYLVRIAEDEPILNPALVEYLRRSFGLTLPDLPALTDDERGDLHAYLQELSELAKAQARARRLVWEVRNDIALSLFSFNKLVMFKDLETNAEAFAQHPLIRQLVSGADSSGNSTRGLPSRIREMEIDRQFVPERTDQVVDADSSQLRAIAAVAQGSDLVLEGPPGTGKSQTITNLIAQALGAGKSVLFVAEKMAALEVVHRRLEEAGLGEFCLELHSSKANKRAVMEELAKAWDKSLTKVSIIEQAQRLPAVRSTLNDYVRSVHLPTGRLNTSPYQALEMLAEVVAAPTFQYQESGDELTQEELEETCRRLEELSGQAGDIGTPHTHPWRGSRRTYFSRDLVESIQRLLKSTIEKLDQFDRLSQDVRRSFKLSIDATTEASRAVRIAEVLARSPGAPLAVLTSEHWNEPPAAATSLIDLGMRFVTLQKTSEQWFKPAAFEHAHQEDIDYVQKKISGVFGFLSVFDGRTRANKKRWRELRKDGQTPSLSKQLEQLREVDRARQERLNLQAKEEAGRALFGALWKGESSDWVALKDYVDWVVEVRATAVAHAVEADALATAVVPRPDTSQIYELAGCASEVEQALTKLRALVDWPQHTLVGIKSTEVRDRLRQMLERLSDAPAWAAFEAARQRAAETKAASLVDAAMEGSLGFKHLPEAFRRAYLQRWLDDVVSGQTILREFQSLAHERKIDEFRRLDTMVLDENRLKVVAKLRDATQRRLKEPAAAAGQPVLRKETVKQRNFSPLRRTIQQCETTIRAIKPCFMMSPLTVAQYLNGKEPTFDLVIFDEASQLTAEDAVGAVIRGKQLVVVGDPKQLPPTDFFSKKSNIDTTVDEDGNLVYEDMESVLEEFQSAGIASTRLKWHYRSAHESLIAFSNASFYDSDLYTFPSAETDRERLGLSFEYVPSGCYEGKGLNQEEARIVADAVVRHFKNHPDESLGVGTFNQRQQMAILDELDRRRREDPSIESFFSREVDEPFFVKNLENIQGDERDVIFLSVTYAKGTDGRLRQNFGPLNGENGWRRLNVLTTRARKRMRVFSSMKGDEIQLGAATSNGPQLLREFLLYAERGVLDSITVKQNAEVESPFEREVLKELSSKGIRLEPQVGVSGYRIDFGVLDDAIPGRFICGIECDGAAYHSSESARDRDRLRQQVLERRGWTIIRVWSTDWFKDRHGQIERLLTLIATARAKAREQEATRLLDKSQHETSTNVRVETDAGPSSTSSTSAPGILAAYTRPSIPDYIVAGNVVPYPGFKLLDAPLSYLVTSVSNVVRAEFPIHVEELRARVATAWGVARIGSRIAARLDEALEHAKRSKEIEIRDEFAWRPNGFCQVRFRRGIRISPERVAIEEYQEAVRLILRSARGLPREELIAEVKNVLGLPRSATLVAGVEAALKRLQESQAIGEGSLGFAIRE